MADLFTSLSTAARALDAQRTGLEAVGQNLANVNTPGYSRRSVSLAEVPPLVLHSVGGGVEVIGVEAARAPLLERRLYHERPAAGREAAVADQLAVVEAGLGDPGRALDARLTEFFDAWATLAEDPTSSVARRSVLMQGQSLAQAFHDVSTEFASVRFKVDAEAVGTVTEINTLAASVASLNVAIMNAPAGTADALIDRRELALQSLAELVDIGVTVRNDAALDVSVGNGRALVAAENAYPVTVTSSSPFGLSQVLSGSTDITSEVTGGRLGGLMLVRDVLIPGYLSRLDGLAHAVATDVNALHAAGYDLDGDTGNDFFTPPAQVAGAASGMAVAASVTSDIRNIAAAGSATGDNLNARAIAALRDGSPGPIDEWGSLVYRIGTDRQTAVAELATRNDVLHQIETLRSQITGVSVDEEAATMLRFQRAYEANARFFSVVDGLLDVLMSNVGR